MKQNRKWYTLKNASPHGTVCYRNHPSKMYDGVPDAYFMVRYQRAGKRMSSGVGWASDGVDLAKCVKLLAKLQRNYNTADGPATIAEMKEIAHAKWEKEQAKRRAAMELEKAMARRTMTAFFHKYYAPRRKRSAAKEFAKNESHFRIWIEPAVGYKLFDDVTLRDVFDLRDKMQEAGKSPRMLQYVFRTFQTIWQMAQDEKWATEKCPTQMQSFTLPKVENNRLRFLNTNEEESLLALARKRNMDDYHMCKIALEAGLRFSEIARLTWRHIDTEEKLIHVIKTKTNSGERKVPMTEALAAMFEEMTRGGAGDLLFPHSDGTVHKQPNHSLRHLFTASGLNDGITDRRYTVSFHVLRHTYASKLLKGGVSLGVLMRLMGHATLNQVMKYAKLATHDLTEAINQYDAPAQTPPPASEPVVKRRSGNVIQLFEGK